MRPGPWFQFPTAKCVSPVQTFYCLGQLSPKSSQAYMPTPPRPTPYTEYHQCTTPLPVNHFLCSSLPLDLVLSLFILLPLVYSRHRARLLRGGSWERRTGNAHSSICTPEYNLPVPGSVQFCMHSLNNNTPVALVRTQLWSAAYRHHPMCVSA